MVKPSHVLRHTRLWAWACFFPLLCVFAQAGVAANPIQLENAKAGTTAWKLDNPAPSREIEGYASLTSVDRGGSISLFVNTIAPSYTISIYRLGWYGGAGARLMLGPITRASVVQPAPNVDSTGSIECNWIDPYTLTVPRTSDPTEWASGVYLAKLTAAGSGLQSYIIFTVRDDARASDYLFQSSVNTWQAYNAWGGLSLYAFNSNGTPARKVSFNRPYDKNQGTGDFLGKNGYGWEPHFLRFLEREGYDVAYATNVDLHEKGMALLMPRKAFLSVGHDEYWSYSMRSAVQQARDAGRHLGFFGANAVYWQVRYENSLQVPSASNRTLVGYKEAAQGSDPYALDADRTNDKFITARFRDLPFAPYNVVDPVVRPENNLIGVMYHGDPFWGDVIVFDSTSWVFAGTGVSNGTHLRGLLGYEDDSMFDNGYAPAGLQKLAESPDTWGSSHVVTYTAPSGAVVFATGTMQWLWGLDDFNVSEEGHTLLVNSAAQQATRNVLARFAVTPQTGGPPAPAGLQASGGVGQISLSWAAVVTAASYNLYRGASSGVQGATPYKAAIAATSFVDTNPSMSSANHYHVTAVNALGESGKSNEASAVAVPLPPTILQAALSGINVRLTWKQSTSPGVVINKVYRSSASGGPYAVVATLSNATSYTDNRVAKKATYYYQLSGVSGAGAESTRTSPASITTK